MRSVATDAGPPAVGIPAATQRPVLGCKVVTPVKPDQRAMLAKLPKDKISPIKYQGRPTMRFSRATTNSRLPRSTRWKWTGVDGVALDSSHSTSR